MTEQNDYTEADALKHIVRTSEDAQVKASLLDIIGLLTADNYHDVSSIDVKNILRKNLMTTGSPDPQNNVSDR